MIFKSDKRKYDVVGYAVTFLSSTTDTYVITRNNIIISQFTALLSVLPIRGLLFNFTDNCMYLYNRHCCKYIMHLRYCNGSCIQCRWQISNFLFKHEYFKMILL